jgi:hypothetical protein
MAKISEALYQEICHEFFDRWESDQLFKRYANVPNEHEGAWTVKEFLSDVLSMPASAATDNRLRGNEAFVRKRPFGDIAAVTFGELMKAVIFMDGRPIPVEALAKTYVCNAVLMDVLSHHVLAVPNVDCEEKRRKLALISTTGPSAEQFATWVRSQPQIEMLNSRLWQETIRKYGHRTLWSFFVAQRNEHGWFFNTEYPFYRLDTGDPRQSRKMRRTESGTHFGQVTVETMRDDTEGFFKCYEWRATLRSLKGTRLAVTAGTVYSASAATRRRVDTTDLVSAGDELSDMDTMLVKSFVDQHGAEAQRAIEDGDIAFVVVWERHPDAEKGSGQACLEVGLRELKKKFSALTTLVIDAKPAQFGEWELPHQPAEIEVAKQEALDCLTNYLDSTAPETFFGKAGMRFNIVQRHDEADAFYALMLLGEELAKGRSQ